MKRVYHRVGCKRETTHERMLKDPREWEEYHRQYREARRTWSVVPYEEIVKRIKQLFTSRMLSTTRIGDFGCGEAKVGKLLDQIEYTALTMLQ